MPGVAYRQEFGEAHTRNARQGAGGRLRHRARARADRIRTTPTSITRMFTTVLIAVAASAVFGLIASIVFSWASNRSAAWYLAFGAALVLGTAVGLLAVVVIAMRRFSP